MEVKSVATGLSDKAFVCSGVTISFFWSFFAPGSEEKLLLPPPLNEEVVVAVVVAPLQSEEVDAQEEEEDAEAWLDNRLKSVDRSIFSLFIFVRVVRSVAIKTEVKYSLNSALFSLVFCF